MNDKANNQAVDILKRYTTEQLRLRNGKNSRETWVAYKKIIYDVSDSPLFKDGKHYRHECGCDLTEQMQKAPHLDDVFQNFKVVGMLE